MNIQTNTIMKKVFITKDIATRDKLIEYIYDSLGIKEVNWSDYKNQYAIKTSQETYEEVLKNGKQFACEKGLIYYLYWVNYYDELRSPVSSCDIAYGYLPKILLPKEEQDQFKNRSQWCSDKYTPPYLLEYFEAMEEFLGVDTINRTYKDGEDALIIAPNDTQYEEQMQKFKQFIEKYGYGPFDRIHPLTFTGKQIDEPFQYTKKK